MRTENIFDASVVAHSHGDRNRSLERGIDILRAFKPGADLLGNGELAERTGLPRATVSRLAQTLRTAACSNTIDGAAPIVRPRRC